LKVDIDVSPDLLALYVPSLALQPLVENAIKHGISVDSVAGQPAVGHDIQFFSLDLTNTCCLRSFTCRAGTILLLWQFTDLDAEQLDPVLKAIVASWRVAG